MNMDFSFVLPAYNEASRIEGCVRKLKRAVDSFSGSYEIVVAEDGSIDGTSHMLARLLAESSHLNFLHSPIRLGKGKAVKNAFRLVRGDVIVFMDVDLATSLEFLPVMIELVKVQKGMVVGSRHIKGSRVQRSFMRTVFSLVYNLLVRLLFRDGIHDHQCGFKVMSWDVAQFVCSSVESDGWFFDTEMVVRCKRVGIRVVEVGVEWVERKKRGESGVKLMRDAAKMGVELLKFWRKSFSEYPRIRKC